MPQVSVVMSVHNEAPYLQETIDSILNQTFTDFEFIIIDDGSTDDTPAILENCDDARIVPLRNTESQGLIHSLNRGFAAATGKYIARIDAHDVAIPTRFEQQVSILDQNPDIGLVGGAALRLDAQGNILNAGRADFLQFAGDHHFLCWLMLWGNVISHITVMMRKSVLNTHHLIYDPGYVPAADYEFWTRIARHTRLLNAPHVWAHRRFTPTGISTSQRATQLETTYEIATRELQNLFGADVKESAFRTIFAMLHEQHLTEPDFRGAADLVTAAYQRFDSINKLSPSEQKDIRQDAVDKLLMIARAARAESPAASLYTLRQMPGVSKRKLFTAHYLKHVGKALLSWR